jgi:hypothetical protein
MKKVILILLIFLCFTIILNAQVSYFKEPNGNIFAFTGGFARSDLGTFNSASISFGFNRFAGGVQYEHGSFSFEGEEYSPKSFTPYFEYVLIRRSFVGFTTGIGFSIFESGSTTQFIPIYASLVFDFFRKKNGFVVMPEFTIGKILQSGLNSSDLNLTGEAGLLAIFRNENGTSFFIRPGISENSETKSPTYFLSGGFIFRQY